MLVYRKYQMLSLNFINEFDTAILYSKFKYISDFIFRQVQERSVFLFEMSPTKTSILYDIAPESEYHTINSKKVIYTKNLNLSKKIISMIVEDESFYLGHLLIIIGTFSRSKISDISNMWEDLLETGIEYFKMGNDGESFYWCNPQINSAEEEFKLFINELTIATKDSKSK
ncbi:hypothetical protein KZO77_12875 [Prevotella melaninogenica]|jgi:conserved domain protein|uniref:Uncharacterized protein n=1 Tax=Prevotella melaninogenica TaxID=28132 RepID=A0ABS6Y8T4_9BACT|nr:hypothetical protein [Prevotella melaninogenica]MBW4755899.1 hypothetical protein [Prevotella melaninogenica]